MKENTDWNIDTASLMYSSNGSFIQITERPLWALFLERVGDRVFPLAELGDWAWKIRWGPVDEYGLAMRSLGHSLWVFSQWAGGGFGAWKQERKIADIPVTDDWVREHYPDYLFTDEDEQMRGIPGDQGDVRL